MGGKMVIMVKIPCFYPNVRCILKCAFHEDLKIHLDNTIWTLYIVKTGLKKQMCHLL
jgi:hypothetical protein